MKKAFASLLAKKRGKKGFTLVELVIVIAVLAIIAGIAVPTVHNVVENANHAADQSNCQAVELALKTTAAEIQAGTNDSGLGWSSTVSEVLKKSGIGDSLPTLKTKGQDAWQYDPDTEKIYVTGLTDYKPSDNHQTLGNLTTLSQIFDES